MKITKYLHSCLLVEEDNKMILIDPGIFTYEANVLDVRTISQLDYLLITHDHPDHFHLPFVKAILSQFPHVTIMTNNTIAKVLQDENIPSITTGNDFITIAQYPHERVFDSTPPENVMFTINNKLSHPGDSLHMENTGPILALPVQAPWCSITEAVEKGLMVKPTVIIPIHDWHWKESVRKAFYTRMEVFFRERGIQFTCLETGETIEI